MLYIIYYFFNNLKFLNSRKLLFADGEIVLEKRSSITIGFNIQSITTT